MTAVEKSDGVIIVIDATEGVTEQDAKIAGIAHERGKGIIIAVNKWDAIEKDNTTVKKHTEKIRQILSFMPYAEILFISVKSGQRVNKLFDLIDVVIENNSMRVQTGVLNEIVAEAVAMQQPPSDKGKRLKIYYITQVAVKPPTFVIFVNNKDLFHCRRNQEQFEPDYSASVPFSAPHRFDDRTCRRRSSSQAGRNLACPQRSSFPRRAA